MREHSARGQAVDRRGDRRFGQFEKTAGHVPIGSLPGNLVDEESKLGQAGRIARAMTDDQQSVEGVWRRIIGHGSASAVGFELS